ncbi:MAG: methyltransferase type 11 [Proteobacteria bacterium]|nr:methyltransferase type 11 [Pseudomonadota bacterium]
MLLDAAELADFYESPMGLLTRRIIARQLRTTWPETRGASVLGYGFAVPYLRVFQGEAERVVAAMPAHQGVVAWPPDRPLSTLVDEDALPFPDGFFNRILVVHGIEGAEAARPLLRQLWRILAPDGRLLLVAANRASLWAQLERSPFAIGRPFSRGELDRLLRSALFEPLSWSRALYVPPFRGRRLARTGMGWDRVLRRIAPGLSGVHIVEAGKTFYGAVPVRARKSAPQWKAAQPAALRDG